MFLARCLVGDGRLGTDLLLVVVVCHIVLCYTKLDLARRRRVDKDRNKRGAKARL